MSLVCIYIYVRTGKKYTRICVYFRCDASLTLHASQGYTLDMADEVEPEAEIVIEAAPAEDVVETVEIPPSDQPLSPRHRRAVELLAQGMPANKVAKELGYSAQAVYNLKINPRIKVEIARASDRIYEDTVKARLKSMATPAMDHVHFVLTDRTNKVKISEKNDMAKWLIEKIDGKAAQVHDVGENLLGVMMDRLDGLKSAGRTLSGAPQAPTLEIEAREVSEPVQPRGPKTDEELLAEWLDANPLG
jgi:hypothetical protein